MFSFQANYSNLSSTCRFFISMDPKFQFLKCSNEHWMFRHGHFHIFTFEHSLTFCAGRYSAHSILEFVIVNASNCVKIVRIRSYSGPYFPALGLNGERYSLSLRIQSECGKTWTQLRIRTLFTHCLTVASKGSKA